MAEETKIILDYAQRPRLWRRRSFRRAVLVVLAVIIAGAGLYWREEISFRIRLAYWQQQCMNHVIPADKVILSADPKVVPVLLSDPDYVTLSIVGSSRTINAAGYRPRCYRELEELIFAGRSTPAAIIFMHRLKSTDGIERLVVAYDTGKTYGPIWPELVLPVEALRPHSLFERRVASGAPWIGGNGRSGGYASSPRIKYHSGQLDPTDPSHVTIRCESLPGGGVRPTPSGTLHIRLSPGGVLTKSIVPDLKPPERFEER